MADKKTAVFGIYPSVAQAEAAVDAIVREGFSNNDVSVLMPDNQSTKQFAHASGIVVATPDGRLSRYFFGIDYAARDVQFALIESSAGKVGSLADKLMLYCYHYDPVTGQYGFVAMRAVRIGGVVTLVALAGFMFVSIRRENRAAGH